ncbi:periplasmic protease [Paenibacillus popilliae ATCC 14706]|uniref:Periplasmic protease n=1 Tax=Paenibacillus popilliae ATCC 14706 TaxID=1212764 RepID=M9LYE3_PAEPP|nr:periplasmic protease [Paenibacillus popilliae ATCC 14706]
MEEEVCPVCGKASLRPIERQAAARVRRSMHTKRLLALLLGLIGILLSDSFGQMALCAAASILLIGLLWFVQRKAMSSEASRELGQLLQREQEQLAQDIFRDWEHAFSHWDDDKQLTYELLRELRPLIRNDTIRLQQLALLHYFSLRKDMGLELEPLLLQQYDPLLADYIGEIAKIKRDLIKDRAFQYVIHYEPEILGLNSGQDILAGVAGAAVRMKRYVLAYPGLIRRYAHRLPKERLLRLHRMIRQHPHEKWDRVADEVNRIVHENYEWDPDFQDSDGRG